LAFSERISKISFMKFCIYRAHSIIGFALARVVGIIIYNRKLLILLLQLYKYETDEMSKVPLRLGDTGE